jgi:hypothetical protein
MPTDLSHLSDADLLALAGMQSPEKNSLSSMSDEELLRLYGAKSKESEPSIMQSLARGAKDAAAGLIGALPDLAAMPYYAYKNARGEHVEPVTEKISRGIDQATSGYTKSHTPGQKVASSVIQGVAGIPGFGGAAKLASKAGIEGVKRAPRLAKGLQQFLNESGAMSRTNLGATTGASALSQHTANVSPDSALAPFIAGIAGGSLGGKAANFKGNSPAAYRAEKIRYDPRLNKIFKTAGIDPTLADVSHSKSLKRAEDNLHHGIFSSSPIAKKKAAQYKKIRGNLGIEGFEESEIHPGTHGSELLEQHIGNYKEKHSQSVKDKENQIDHILENLPEDKAYADVQDIIKHYEKEKSKYRANAGKELFDERESSKIVNNLKEKAPSSQLDAKSLRELRQHIDDKIKYDKVTFGKEDAQLFELRSHVNDILQKHSKVTPELQELWDQTNKSHHQYLSREEPILNKYSLSKKNANKENKPFIDLIEDLKNKNTTGKDFSYLTDKVVPHSERLKFTQLAIHQLGMKKGTFDLLHFKNNFLNLDKNKRDVLLAGLSKVDKKKFESNMKALDKLKVTEGNVTGSGHTVNTGKDIHELAHATSDLALGHDPGAWVKLIGRLGATVGASRFMTNPANITKMDKAFNAKTLSQKKEYLRKLDAATHDKKYKFLPYKTAARTGLKYEKEED